MKQLSENSIKENSD